MKHAISVILLLLLPTHVALAESPADPFVAKAHAALQRGDKDESLAAANQAVAADPKNATALALRGAIYDARREFDKAAADYTRVIDLLPGTIGAYQRRGEDRFRLGQFAESVADFDKVIELEPAREPYHWQRGISLYYAGEFERGVKQFDGHKSVNPNDVENAVWHYLCIARLSGVEKARQALMPIKGDTRIPMAEVHKLFAGAATPQDVLTAAQAGAPGADELKQRLFYAHLYIGLYLEAAAQPDAAKEHIFLAADKYADDNYMGDVARVHAAKMRPKK